MTIEPAQLAGDATAGLLIARLQPSPFNKEDIKVTANPSTGFLSTITSDSRAQLLAIVAEAAKTAGRLAMESGRTSFLESKVTLLQDSFDPLSPADVTRINRAIDVAIRQGIEAFPQSGGRARSAAAPFVRVSVLNLDGSTAMPGTQPRLDGCRVGICVRAMTWRTIRADVNGTSHSKVVAIPYSEVVPVPMPNTVLADQNISITVDDGILKEYNVKRDSELLGLVGIPGAILDGIVAGLLQNFKDSKSILDAQKGTLESVKAVEDAKKAVATAIKTENSAAGGAASTYAAQTMTFYSYPATLAAAIRAKTDAEKEKKRNTPAPATGQQNRADLLDGPPAPQPPAASVKPSGN